MSRTFPVALILSLFAFSDVHAIAQLQLETTVGKASVYCTIPAEPTNCSPPPAGIDNVDLEPGEDFVVGYTVLNTGDVTFIAHTLVDSVEGTQLNQLPYNLLPGASAFLAVRFTAPLTTGVQPRSATWTGHVTGGATTSDFDLYAINVLAPQFTVRAGVAPAAAVCPNPGDLSGCTMPEPNSAEFVPGQQLVVGYQITNTGSYALPTHTLFDSAIGTILNNFPYELAPGGSAFIDSFLTPTGLGEHSGTWTVTTTHGATASVIATYAIVGPLFADGFE